jgi:hypothetical protein
MKNKFYKNIIVIVLILLACGCKKFLEESSQDELRPGSANDLQQLLLGEAYPISNYFINYIELMTDDVTSNFVKDAIKLPKLYNGEAAFTWQDNMFETMNNKGLAGVDTYEHYYRRIKGCNVVLDMLNQVSGSEEEKSNVKGQALAMRSYYYFMLVNLFGQPYNAEGLDVEQSLGVPLVLVSRVKDELPVRASVGQIYRQIEADLLTAGPLLEQYGQKNSKFKATSLFVYTLLSRMYLYMEKWDKSIEYANKVLERNPQLLKLSNCPIPATTTFPTINVFDQNSPEAIWFFSTYEEFNQFFIDPAYGDKPLYAVSKSLEESYEHNWADNAPDRKDLRPAFFYRRYYISKTTYDVRLLHGTKRGGNPYFIKGMRVAESYLNRAEGYIHQYLKNGDASLRIAALKDLNHLREYRYDTRNASYVPIEISDGQQLLEFCRNERRRELCFEEHRWFDLRRYGMPEIKHTFQGFENQTPREYILPNKGKRYVLPIPQSELQRNPELVPNP